MNSNELDQLIGALISGDISAEDHQRLQSILKSDAEARRRYREKMDIEAALRTWASESPDETQPSVQHPVVRNPTPKSKMVYSPFMVATVACVVMGFFTLLLFWRPGDDQNQVVEQEDFGPPAIPQLAESALGSIRQTTTTKWDSNASPEATLLKKERLKLVRGVAELKFDSGTDVVLEAPCELLVTSSTSAKLISGNVFVNVTELSNGFILETPEAQIIDEGTQYAVALDDSSAEVHVFEGSVFLVPNSQKNETEVRIEAGHARSYSRSMPSESQQIVFGERQFVRTLNTAGLVESQETEKSLAYDGFESQETRLRLAKTGYGWADGWELSRKGRGRVSTIVDAPEDHPLGIKRAGTRLLLLDDGDDIRRSFEEPISTSLKQPLFVSLSIQRTSENSPNDSIRVFLESERAPARRRSSRPSVAFGISSQEFPFINDGQSVNETALSVINTDPILLVFRIKETEFGQICSLRVLNHQNELGVKEPESWTVKSVTKMPITEFQSIRIQVGESSSWQVDELKIGRSWNAVTKFAD